MKKQLKDQFKNFFDDLLKLEINTIVKDCITGNKMSGARLGLIKIAKKYNRKLGLLDPDLKLGDEVLIGSPESYKEIYKKVTKKINSYKELKNPTEDDNANMWLLYRIKDTSKKILKMFCDLRKRAPAIFEKIEDDKSFWNEDQNNREIRLDFTTDELVIIRKAWELGTEEIAIQTVIQLDGDVTTRIQTKYAKKMYSGLNEVHNQGVATSIKFWKTLVGLVKDLVGSIFKLV